MKLVKYVLSTLIAILTVGMAGFAFAQEAVTEATLAGTWNADMAATLATLPADQQAAMAGLDMGSATMTLNADYTGAYHHEMGEEVQDSAGTWSFDPATSTLTVLDAADGSSESMVATTPDANTLVLTNAEGMAMVWTRAAAE